MSTPTIRTDRLDNLHLGRGAHQSPDAGMCLMEAVAYIRGIKHTDRPACVSPFLGDVGRSLNDRLDDTHRQKLIPYIPLLPGTASDGLDDVRQAMARDYTIRVVTPKWLDKAGLTEHASTLRDLPQIVDEATHRAARPAVEAARRACWDIRSQRYGRIKTAVREALANRPAADAAAVAVAAAVAAASAVADAAAAAVAAAAADAVADAAAVAAAVAAAAAVADAAAAAVAVAAAAAAADDRYWTIRDAVYAKVRALYEERYADLLAESADDAIALYGRLINAGGAPDA
jgi:hypothetical protein